MSSTRFTLDDHKTKAFAQALSKLGFDRKILVIDHQENPNLWLAARNIAEVRSDPEPAGHAVSVVECAPCRVFEGGHSGFGGGAEEMSTHYDVIVRPVITEKGLTLKEDDRTLCFEVANKASKKQIQEAVERIFKVKVAAGAHDERARQDAAPGHVTSAIARTGRRRTSRFVKAKK